MERFYWLKPEYFGKEMNSKKVMEHLLNQESYIAQFDADKAVEIQNIRKILLDNYQDITKDKVRGIFHTTKNTNKPSEYSPYPGINKKETYFLLGKSSAFDDMEVILKDELWLYEKLISETKREKSLAYCILLSFNKGDENIKRKIRRFWMESAICTIIEFWDKESMPPFYWDITAIEEAKYAGPHLDIHTNYQNEIRKYYSKHAVDLQDANIEYCEGIFESILKAL